MVSSISINRHAIKAARMWGVVNSGFDDLIINEGIVKPSEGASMKQIQVFERACSPKMKKQLNSLKLSTPPCASDNQSLLE
jgi:hypothetical protein